MQLCPCRATAALCDACVVAKHKHLGGAAEARGHYYADSVWKRYGARQWKEEKARAIARRKLADLETDERVLSLLVEDWLTGARRRIEQGDTPLAELALRRARHGLRSAELPRSAQPGRITRKRR